MQLNTNLKKIDKIYHLADIHFPKNIISDTNIYSRYINMMNNIITHSSKYTNCVMAITGDLLNNNDQGSPDLIKLCIQFINSVSQYMPVIIIAGNHDYNHTTGKTWFDVIDAATNNNVFFLTTSGYYILTSKTNRILIGFQSITDKYYSFFYQNQNVNQAKEFYKCNQAIALFHGNVNGSKIHTKTWTYDESTYTADSLNTDYNVNKHWLTEYNFVLLGHIHERQKIEPNIFYAGSTIQRTFAESYDNHGGYLFNLVNKQYIPINYKDIYANITLNEIDVKLHVALPYKDRKYYIKIHHSDSLSSNDRKEIESFYYSNFDIVNINWQYKSTEKAIQIHQESNVNNIFDTIICDYSDDVQKKLKDIHSHNIIQSKNTHGSTITLKTLKWQNIFCYGLRLNKIDFENDITVISAANTTGKSTIWRIILVALYADIDQRLIVSKLIENIVNKYATQGWIELTCNINNNECVILRQFKVNNSRCSHSYTITVNGVQCDKSWLKNNLIPYDIMLSNFSLTKDSESIYSKTLGKLQKYINDTFNLDQISDQIVSISSDITAKTSKLIALTSKRDTVKSKLEDLQQFDIDDIEKQIEDNTTTINSLVKPVNDFKMYQNLNVIKGSVTDILVKPFEYNDVVTYYNTKKLNKDIISIYCSYNSVNQSEILSLHNEISYSNTLKSHIDNNNVNELAILLNIPNNDLANMCWKDIQQYKQYVRNHDYNISDINIQECANYLFKSNLIIPDQILDNVDYNIIKLDNMCVYSVYDVEKCTSDDILDNFDTISSIYELYELLKSISCSFIADNDIKLSDTTIFNNVDETSDHKSIFDLIKKIKRSVFSKYNKDGMKLQEDLIRINKILNNNPIDNLYNLSKEELVINLKSCINIISEIINNDKYVNILRENNTFITLDYLNKIYTYCVIYINKYNEYALLQNTMIWNYHCNKISKYYKYLQQFDNQDMFVINTAKQHICPEEKYKQYDNTRKTIYFWCQNIIHTITDKYNTFESEFEEYTRQYIDLTKSISTLENSKEHYINNLQEYTKLQETLNIECDNIENDIDLLKKYKLSLENTRIQTIKNGLKSLETHINNDLETYIDYKLYITFKEATNKTTQFSINIKHKKTEQIIAYDNLSGYEKAIVQFITMHIINSFSPYNFNVFYIDEAFDVFDEHNFNKYISQLLNIASDYSDNVLFVTHRSLPVMSVNYIQKTIEQYDNTSVIC